MPCWFGSSWKWNEDFVCLQSLTQTARIVQSITNSACGASTSTDASEQLPKNQDIQKTHYNHVWLVWPRLKKCFPTSLVYSEEHSRINTLQIEMQPVALLIKFNFLDPSLKNFYLPLELTITNNLPILSCNNFTWLNVLRLESLLLHIMCRKAQERVLNSMSQVAKRWAALYGKQY